MNRLSLVILLTVFSTTVTAAERFDLEIQGGAADQSIRSLSHQTGVPVIFRAEHVRDTTTEPILGRYTIEEALNLLLTNTALSASLTGGGVITIAPKKRDEPSSSPSSGLDEQGGSDMKTLKAGFWSTLFGTAAVAGAGSAWAQEQAGESAKLEEVVVTASRRGEQNLQDVAMSIFAIDPDEFTASGIIELQNIIDYTPGVTYRNLGSPQDGQITVRGITQESFVPTTAIYVDDIPVTTSTPYSFGANVFLDGLLGDLERVEFIKGPQGTLYGASAMAGVIRYITRDPALDEMRGSLTADIGSIEGGDINQLYRGSISLPVIEDKLGFTLSAFWDDRGGYIEGTDDDGNIIDDDINESERWGLSGAALLQINDKARLKLTAMRQNSSHSFGSSVLLRESDPARNDPLDPSDVKGLVSFPGDYQANAYLTWITNWNTRSVAPPLPTSLTSSC
ncbi:MAG: TonB-dependent receptor plug domain-containing protein [Pseudomonadota bacterium]